MKKILIRGSGHKADSWNKVITYMNNDYDKIIIIIGTPIRMGMIHKKVKEFINKIAKISKVISKNNSYLITFQKSEDELLILSFISAIAMYDIIGKSNKKIICLKILLLTRLLCKRIIKMTSKLGKRGKI